MQCRDSFLSSNESIETLNLPNLIRCGDNFLFSNANLLYIDLPKLKECGSGFLHSCTKFLYASLPKLSHAYYLGLNTILKLKLERQRILDGEIGNFIDKPINNKWRKNN